MSQTTPVSTPSSHLSRRRLIARGGGFLIAGGLLSMAPWDGALAKLAQGPRELSFVNLHTGERAAGRFWTATGPDLSVLEDFRYVLRDWRTDEQYDMDLQLYALLADLRRRMDSDAPFQVISGYRSPKTNANLASQSNGVAKRSLHMQGRAIDIRLEGRDLSALRRTAWEMQRGGVGYYPKSGFIHVDTGRVRRWGG